MPTKTRETDGNRPLAVFQTVVQQQEEIFGPLKELGHRGSNNTMKFEIGAAPDKGPVLTTFEGAQPPDKADHTLICSGDCLVNGAPEKVAAYRPS